MSYVVNRLARVVWEMGTTGEAANIVDTLTRYPNSSTETAATETVTIAEVASTGAYYVTFTPTNADNFYMLRLVHSGGASPTYREITFIYDVEGGASEAAEDKSYASEADVVAYAQHGSYSASTTPTLAQVRGFLEQRSARVYARLTKVMGDAAPGPSGYSTTIDETEDRGVALARVLRRCAAIGAAIDAMQAAGVNRGPETSNRIDMLNALWEQALDDLDDPALAYLDHGTRTSTHISSGQVTRQTITATTEQGLIFDTNTQF